MAYINMTGLRKEIAGQYSSSFKRVIERQIRKKVEMVKAQMLNEFNRHAVTKDIEGGAGGVLSKGDLFSFIGFNSGDMPTASLRMLLLQSLRVRVTRVMRSDVSVDFVISIPSREEIEAITPMPWASGRSWAREVELGIPGLGKYLVKDSPSSRSGKAIQVTGVIDSSKFGGTPYMTDIIGNLIKNLTSTLGIQ